MYSLCFGGAVKEVYIHHLFNTLRVLRIRGFISESSSQAFEDEVVDLRVCLRYDLEQGIYQVTYVTSGSGTSDVTINVQYVASHPNIWILADSNSALSSTDCQISGALRTNFNLRIAGAENPKVLTVDGRTTGCPFTNTPTGSSTYTINFLTKLDAPNNTVNDLEFSFTFSGDTTQLQFSGTTVFTTPAPPTPVALTAITAVDYNPNLLITDHAGTAVTRLALGDRAKLQFKMTIPNYIAFLDSAGARVTNCLMSDTTTFNASNGRVKTMIDGNGCFDAALEIRNTNEGFTAVPDAATTPKNFLAETPIFEMINLEIRTATGDVDLYFQCEITYCDDDSSITAGNCGGPHCSAATGRKRRDTDVVHTVTTKVTITGKQDTEKRCSEDCDMTDGYKISMGVMGGLAAILLVSMLFNYKSVMGAIERRIRHERSRPGSSSVDTSSRGYVTMSELSRATGAIPKSPPSHVSLAHSRMSKKAYN